MFAMAFVVTSSSSCAAAACCVGYGIEEGNLHRETKCALPGYSQPYPRGRQPTESQEDWQVGTQIQGFQGTRVLPRFLPGLPQHSISPSMIPMEMCHQEQLPGSPTGIRGIVSRQGRHPMLCRKRAFWDCTGFYIIECLGEEPKGNKGGI